MSNTFVIPDMHGMWQNLEALLEAAGILEGGYRKDEDIDVISLGDLANCVGDPRRDGTENDFKCLQRVGKWIDLMLVGNHESPYWGNEPFGGFRAMPTIGNMLSSLEKEHHIAPAACVDGILLTHAGVGKQMAEQYGWDEPDQAAGELEAMWTKDSAHSVFNTVGRSRGGWAAEGGIMWADFSEPKTDNFRQLIGHSVGGTVRSFGTPGSPAEGSYCIDLGSGRHGNQVAGAFIRDGEIEILEVTL